MPSLEHVHVAGADLHPVRDSSPELLHNKKEGAGPVAKSKNDPAAVDAYFASLPQAEVDTLEPLRRLIKQIVPDVQERVSYGTTVMFSVGRDLVGFASQSNHLSFFTASPTLAASMKGEITKTHKVSGATIHFSPDNPLPPDLVKRILVQRLAENAALNHPTS